MSTMLRLWQAAVSAGRTLGRRRVAMALLVCLPLAFYFSSLNSSAGPGTPPFKVIAGTLGMSWAIGSAAVFLLSGARRVDERLVLAGYFPWEICVNEELRAALARSAPDAEANRVCESLAQERVPDNACLDAIDFSYEGLCHSASRQTVHRRISAVN